MTRGDTSLTLRTDFSIGSGHPCSSICFNFIVTTAKMRLKMLPTKHALQQGHFGRFLYVWFSVT